MHYYRGYSTVFTMESVFSIPDNRNIWWAMGLEMTDRLLEIIRYSYTAQQRTAHCNQCRDCWCCTDHFLWLYTWSRLLNTIYISCCWSWKSVQYNTFYFKVRTFCKSNKVHLKMFCALKIHFRVHDTSDTFIIVAKYHLQRQYKTKVSLSFFAFCLLIKQN